MTVDDLDGFVERQVALMRSRLDAFRSGSISIARLISDLEGLLAVLDGHVAADWADAFVRQWAELEIAYAVALDQRAPVPAISDRGVKVATDELTRLVGAIRRASGQR